MNGRRTRTYKLGEIVEADGAGRRRAAAAQEEGRPSSSPTPSTCRRGKRTSTSSRRPTRELDDDRPARSGARQRARRPATSSSRQRDKVQFIDVSPKQLVSVAAVADPVPRERRRQPRADGIEHAAPGRAAAAAPGRRLSAPAWMHHRARLGRGDRGQASRHRRLRRLASASSCASRARPRTTGKEMGADIYPMTKFKRSNQNTCINQKPIVRVGQKVHKGQVLARRAVHRARRARARPQRAGRVHAVARLQLRGRDPRVRADGEGRLLHVDPHRGVRDRGARHQARAGGNHARHPERRRRAYLQRPRRERHHPHRRRTSSRATSSSARSRRRARRS